MDGSNWMTVSIDFPFGEWAYANDERAGLRDDTTARTPHEAREQGLAVDIDRVSRRFGERTVLHELDLRIAAGEFVAIIGRSGCGKSSLLRLVAGLDEPDGGEISFGTTADRDAVRIMFQEARLLPWKTVLDNVALGLPRDALEHARELLAQVGLAERGGEWPAVLSGGQRQRVALARALVHDPRLLLLDEPLGALDALTRIEMQALIESLWFRKGLTAVLVTHDVAEAVALADRVIVIEDGHVSQDLRIDLPRPRARGQAAFAAYEEKLLDRLLRVPLSAVGIAPTVWLDGVGG